jgi:uncharacterized membrane protein YeaQ/YmgE (transglycosylase-associated protein family)
MNPSFISLIGILFGVLGANSIFFINKKRSFGITGNSIIGVFSSVFFIKTLGKLFHLFLDLKLLSLVIFFIGSFIIGYICVLLSKKFLCNL